jgi:inositol-phosphate transport system ATP-binding protein
MSMCDRIAIMKSGEIVQIATPSEMYKDPRTSFVASFLGNPPISFLKGQAQQGAFVLGGSSLRLPLATLAGVPDGTALSLGVRPEHFGTAAGTPVEGKVVFAETQGRENLYDVVLPDGSVLRSIQPVREDVKPGDSVRWNLDSASTFVFAEDGQRL